MITDDTRTHFYAASPAERAAIWFRLTEGEKNRCRDLSGLTPQLIGLEGWRVEVTSELTGYKRRFIVGRSTGWRPCHVELHNRTSHGGPSASFKYASVRLIRKVR